MEKEVSKTFQMNEAAANAGRDIFKNVLEEESKRPMELQEELIMTLLRDNQDTEYGKKYDFASIKTIEDYQKKVPVITYDDIAEYIERMKEGEKNLLTVYPFDHMNETSGTVGVPKYIPMTDKQSQVFMKYNYHYLNGLKAELLDNEWFNGRTFCTSEGNYTRLPSGITLGCASSKMAETVGGLDAFDKMMQVLYTSPVEATAPNEGTDTKYIHMRFAVADSSITGIVTGFYSMVTHMLQYFADNYEMFINDIEQGTIDESVRMPDDVKEKLLSKIQPMPERAAELREIFKDGADFPFLHLVWPKLKYISGVGAASFSIYSEKLRDRFGKLINIYSGITASEGLWSVPVGLDNPNSMLTAGSAFMEFLPVEAGDDFSKAVTMDKVEEGGIYELIVTNPSGFYRYRMSDAVKVTGFKNKTPLVQFMYRVNKTINLIAEKTTEAAIDVTVRNTAEKIGFPLSDYCVYPDPDCSPNKYVFLIEPDVEGSVKDMEELARVIYDELSIANPVFKECVEEGDLQKPEVHLLQPETSLLYRDMMIYKGSSPSQLKPVHVISNERQRKFFFGLIED